MCAMTRRLLDSQVMPAYLAETSERSVRSWCLELQGSGQQIQTCSWKSIMPFRGMKELRTLAVIARKEEIRNSVVESWIDRDGKDGVAF